jgi:hypothetical protein
MLPTVSQARGVIHRRANHREIGPPGCADISVIDLSQMQRDPEARLLAAGDSSRVAIHYCINRVTRRSESGPADARRVAVYLEYRLHAIPINFSTSPPSAVTAPAMTSK